MSHWKQRDVSLYGTISFDDWDLVEGVFLGRTIPVGYKRTLFTNQNGSILKQLVEVPYAQSIRLNLALIINVVDIIPDKVR